MTADAYLEYHTTKHSNTQTDPLEVILKCISNNPLAYADANTTSNSHNTQFHQQTKIPSKEGQRIKRITVSKAVKLSIMITDKKL